VSDPARVVKSAEHMNALSPMSANDDAFCKRFSETTRADDELSDSGSESTHTGTATMSQNLDGWCTGDASWSPADLHNEPGERSPAAALTKRAMLPRRPSAISEEGVGDVESATAEGEAGNLMDAAGETSATVAAAAAAAANAVAAQRRLQRQQQEEAKQLPSVICDDEEPDGSESEHRQLGAPPGLSDPLVLPSRGSEMHCSGDCSPCVWHWKPQGCFRGSDCGYCHICPEGEIKMRKKAKLVTLRSGSRGLQSASDEAEQQKASEEAEEQAQLQSEDSPSEARKPTPSAGSAFHFTGECRPCAWFWNPRGCQNGRECRHCHLCPEGEIKRRRKLKVEAMQKDKQADDFCKAASPKAQEDPHKPMKVITRDIPDEEDYADTFPPPPGLAEPASLKVADMDAQALSLEPKLALPSVGSATHGTGECRPCAWFWKPQGCQNGQECRHCHLCPEGEMRARKKDKAESLRQEKELNQQLDEGSPLGLGQVWPQPAGLPFLPLMPPPPPLPSIGSSLHGTGLCRPCAWFWKPQGCQNAQECCHCHLCPSGEIKARRKVKVAVLRHQSSVQESLELQQEGLGQWESPWAAHKEPYVAF